MQALNKTTDAEVVSDYAVVNVEDLDEFSIIDKIKYNTDEQVVRFEKDVDNVTPESHKWDVSFVYNESLDMLTVVETYADQIDALISKLGIVLDNEDVDRELVYEFSKIDKYELGTEKTDQQKFISINDNIVTVNKEWLSQGTAAVGRTPIVKVVAKVKGVQIAEAYLKVLISEKEISPEEQGDHTVTMDLGNIEYTTIAASGNTYSFPWDRVNKEIYDVLGLTKETFVNNYNTPVTDPAQVTGVDMTSWNLDDATTTTSIAALTIDPTVKFGENEIKVTYKAKDNYAYKNVVIVFTYNIVHELQMPSLNPDYTVPGEKDMVQIKGRAVNGAWKMEGTLKEQFAGYLENYTLPANHTKLFFVLPTYPADQRVEITGNDYTDQIISQIVPLGADEPYRDVPVQLVAACANGEYCTYAYTVRFIRPFDVTIDAFKLKTLMADPSTQDLSALVTIVDKDGKVVYENNKLTSLGTNTYKLSQDELIFTYNFKEIAGEEPFGEGTLKMLDDNKTIWWYNMGTDLMKDKHAKSVVTVVIPELATIEAEGDITVLSTANSK